MVGYAGCESGRACQAVSNRNDEWFADADSRCARRYECAFGPEAGFQALYLSGAAYTASRGLPDLGLIYSNEVAERARDLVRASKLPLLVDIDTGYGGVLNVARTAQRDGRSRGRRGPNRRPGHAQKMRAFERKEADIQQRKCNRK